MDTGIINTLNKPVIFENKLFKKEVLIQHKEDFFKFMQVILDEWEQKKQIPVIKCQTISEEHVIKILKMTENDKVQFLKYIKENNYREIASFLTVCLSPNSIAVNKEGTRYDFLALCYKINKLYEGKLTNDGKKLGILYFNQIIRFFISSYLKDENFKTPETNFLIDSKENIPLSLKNSMVRWQSGCGKEKSTCPVNPSLEILVSSKTAKLLDQVTHEIRQEFLKLNLIMTNQVAKKYGTLENLTNSKVINYIAISISKEEEKEIKKKYKVSLVTAKEGKEAMLVAFIEDTMKFTSQYLKEVPKQLTEKNERYEKITMFFVTDTMRRLWTENDQFPSSYWIPYRIDKSLNEVLSEDLKEKNVVAGNCTTYAVRKVISKLWAEKTSPHISEIYEEIK